MSQLLQKNQGLFDPSKRFAFTNITTEDFVSAWNGSPITIKAGVTVELPHHLANKLTDELVDKIIIGDAKLDEVTKSQPYYRSPIGMSLGVPAARKVWEDQIVRELAVDEESPQVQVMRAELRAELEAELTKQPSREPIPVPTSLSEFSELSNDGTTQAEAPKKPLRVKEIKK